MYRLFQPALPLRPYIENYWLLRANFPSNAPLTEDIFSDGQADIVFNFGETYTRRNLADGASSNMRSNLDFQRLHPISISQKGHVELVGVRFRAGGLAAVLREVIGAFSNTVHDPLDALGHDARRLEAQLYDCRAHPAQQAHLLDAFFLKRLRIHATHQRVMLAAERIAHQTHVSIHNLSAEMGYSIRSMDRLFYQFFGFSPKTFERMTRVQRAIHLMYRQPHRSLTELAHACAYYDQAHFSRDFHALTGSTPSAFRARLMALSAALPPNLVQFLQDEPSTRS